MEVLLIGGASGSLAVLLVIVLGSRYMRDKVVQQDSAPTAGWAAETGNGDGWKSGLESNRSE